MNAPDKEQTKLEQDFKSLKEFIGKNPGQYNQLRYRLGMMYFHARGTPKDDVTAFKLVQEAAKDNVTEAKIKCGIMLLEGYGCKPDFEAAKQWLAPFWNNKSEPHKGVLFYRAKMFAKGWGETPNEVLATKHYRASADLGYVEAQHELACRYSTGCGVEKSKDEALQWFLKAAKEEHAESQFQLAELLSTYADGSKQVKAKEWYVKAANNGHEGAKKWRDKHKKVEFSLGEKKEQAGTRQVSSNPHVNTATPKKAF